jgi:hypothetical protein
MVRTVTTKKATAKSTPISAAPPNALRMWRDASRIYVELPGSPGNDPYIIAYLFSEGGLSKALALLPHGPEYDHLGTIPSSYQKRWSGSNPAKPEPATEMQRIEAEALLHRLGMLK